MVLTGSRCTGRMTGTPYTGYAPGAFGSTSREHTPRTAAPVSSLSCGSPSHPAERLRQESNNTCEMDTHKRSAVFTLIVSDCEIQILSFLCLHGSGDKQQRGKRDNPVRALPAPFPLGFLPRAPFFLTPFPPFRQICLDCFDRLHLYRSHNKHADRRLCSRCVLFQSRGKSCEQRRVSGKTKL